MSDVSITVAVAANLHPSPLWIAALITWSVLRVVPEWWLDVLVAVETTRRLRRAERARRRHKRH